MEMAIIKNTVARIKPLGLLMMLGTRARGLLVLYFFYLYYYCVRLVLCRPSRCVSTLAHLWLGGKRSCWSKYTIWVL